MKQKYLLEKQEDNSLKIREYGELEEKSFSLMCEESFDFESFSELLDKDIKELTDFLRTDNIFPPKLYAEKIAEAIKGIYDGSLGSNTFELIFDDMEFVARDIYEEDEEDEEELIDSLLDEEEDFDSMEDDIVDIDPGVTGPIKVDDDTDVDVDL